MPVKTTWTEPNEYSPNSYPQQWFYCSKCDYAVQLSFNGHLIQGQGLAFEEAKLHIVAHSLDE